MPAVGLAMPKKNPKPSKNDQGVRIAADVAQMARSIVSVKGGTIAKLISDQCRPAFAKIIQQLQESGAFLPKPSEDGD